MIDDPGTLLTAFLVGLLGGVHCLGMCGGIVATLTAGLPRRARASPLSAMPYQLAYNAGRLAGYALAGALMGGLGVVLAQSLSLQQGQRLLYGVSGLVMVLLGLHLADWWRGLARVEALGGRLWRHLEPLGRGLLPVTTPARALGLGFIWAWLPCGLVYSVLIWAMAAGSPVQGASLLLAFGLGTLPNLLGIGLLAGAVARVAHRPAVRRAAGLLVIGFGLHALWQLVRF
ncbi:sulfite exporter TauE/SafE family protein [Thiococcus pfennigii]|jgi:sulfite exporter TauE/SafE|uniref:sulfite exporter TauE/SafE family protein n=1 Tax=Thiococcus pfennigii TaxID=1057 RepID=UPI0019045DBC|nr:sulfite exporter TauE/SafE family protein [Thiococcus pfennigii]MBK1701920.1 hypothetical protein [Thiococcus pfennigii]MBK1730416.1 hypothetical protein [Thiococcus pfennigii]